MRRRVPAQARPTKVDLSRLTLLALERSQTLKCQACTRGRQTDHGNSLGATACCASSVRERPSATALLAAICCKWAEWACSGLGSDRCVFKPRRQCHLRGEVRQGQSLHPALPVRLATPARNIRSQARGACRNPGRNAGRFRRACRACRSASGLPQVAQIMDRVTVVRSMTHPYPVHGVAYALTGMPTYTPAIEATPRAAEHWPFFGSVVDYLDERSAMAQGAGGAAEHGPALAVRFEEQPAYLGRSLRGVPGASLRPGLDRIRRQGDKGRAQALRRTNQRRLRSVRRRQARGQIHALVKRRIAGRTFRLAQLGLRRSLLAQFDQARSWLADDARVEAFDKQRQMAWSLIATSRIREALDIGREPAAVRERYGMTLVRASRRWRRGGWSRREADSSRSSGIRSSRSAALAGTRTPTTFRG